MRARNQRARAADRLRAVDSRRAPRDDRCALEHRPELARALVAGPALVTALLGLPAFDMRLAACVEPSGDRHASRVVLPEAIEEVLATFATPLAHASRRPVIVLVADAAQAPEAAASSLVHRWQRGLLRVLGSTWPNERWAAPALALVARLRGDAVLVDLEEWQADARRLLAPLFHALARAHVPVVVVASPATDWRAVVREHAAMTICLDEPDVAARRRLWSRAVSGSSADASAISQVAEHFRLGPAQIDDAARTLAFAPSDDVTDLRTRLFRAARGQSSGDLGHLAQLVPQRHAWADLVLPAAVTRRLRDVSGAVAARAKVFGDWGFGKRSGAGLMVMFAGTSGTGKTMSASVIAREIGLELYRIELASIVSKYIGETEKNLHRLFEAARRANVMLFFDEADALLGRRSEVKDAHDRYANIEVAYLLQKMEEHDGVIILASNLAKNMDQAFSRRLHYIVEFPRPDAPLRERLWQAILPPEIPRDDDIDFAFLGRQFELAGGDIKTITLDAAFIAAAAGRPLGMADLIGAVSRQMLKQGRPPSASDFKQYHQHSVGSGAAR
ncbi:MAG: AAA family ATPase [Kofleriaceae bacterium]